jgi:hypothetical protein
LNHYKFTDSYKDRIVRSFHHPVGDIGKALFTDYEQPYRTGIDIDTMCPLILHHFIASVAFYNFHHSQDRTKSSAPTPLLF